MFFNVTPTAFGNTGDFLGLNKDLEQLLAGMTGKTSAAAGCRGRDGPQRADSCPGACNAACTPAGECKKAKNKRKLKHLRSPMMQLLSQLAEVMDGSSSDEDAAASEPTPQVRRFEVTDKPWQTELSLRGYKPEEIKMAVNQLRQTAILTASHEDVHSDGGVDRRQAVRIVKLPDNFNYGTLKVSVDSENDMVIVSGKHRVVSVIEPEPQAEVPPKVKISAQESKDKTSEAEDTKKPQEGFTEIKIHHDKSEEKDDITLEMRPKTPETAEESQPEKLPEQSQPVDQSQPENKAQDDTAEPPEEAAAPDSTDVEMKDAEKRAAINDETQAATPLEETDAEVAEVTSAFPFEVKLALDGFNPEKIRVQLAGDVVTLTGEVEHRDEDAPDAITTRHFQRSWTLPQDANPDELRCILGEDGILRITAPRKSDQPKQRTLTIETC